jgi:hypothetical protein
MTGGMTCEPLLDVAEPRLETALALFDLVQRAEDRGATNTRMRGMPTASISITVGSVLGGQRCSA